MIPALLKGQAVRQRVSSLTAPDPRRIPTWRHSRGGRARAGTHPLVAFPWVCFGLLSPSILGPARIGLRHVRRLPSDLRIAGSVRAALSILRAFYRNSSCGSRSRRVGSGGEAWRPQPSRIRTGSWGGCGKWMPCESVLGSRPQAEPGQARSSVPDRRPPGQAHALRAPSSGS